MSKLALSFGLLGLYIGQVMFRLSGSGRLTYDSYNSEGSILLQLFFSALHVGLFKIADKIAYVVGKDILSLWVDTIFLRALPLLLVGYLLAYRIPSLTSRTCNYPKILSEVTETDNTHDPEVGS